MKRLLLLGLAVFLLLAGALRMRGPEADVLNQAREELGLSLTGASVLSVENEYGGFHGDGSLRSEIAPVRQEPAMLESPWRSMPLSETARALVYGNDSQEPHFEAVSAIGAGLWLLIDRHPNAPDPYIDAGLLHRASFNYTLALYDPSSLTLYYFRFDT